MSTIDVGAAPQSLADLAYDGLRARLVTLEIAPGSPINDETLATELGVGRGVSGSSASRAPPSARRSSGSSRTGSW